MRDDLSSAAGAKRTRAPRNSGIADRLALHSIPEPNSGCLLWLGSVDGRGRPKININGKRKRASRVAYELRYGPLSSGQMACHRCDVELCINDAHLFAGTAAENAADMVAKRRNARGEKVGNSKLTAEMAAAIKVDPRTQRVIAASYGIGKSTVGDVKRGRIWSEDT